ncbi:MAG TPA: peptidoglycan DD-metalloendopeptidase family protein [Acidimicrobiia bacterium]|nr:peptidoglycan DD-metalloendopeptidase family protein [Acidimicrobiia bacterium]
MRHRVPSSRRTRSRVGAIIVSLALALSVGSIAHADTEADISRAEAELADLQAQADDLASRIEASWERQYVLEERIAALTDAQTLVEIEFTSALADLEATAIRLYMDVAAGEGMSAVLATNGEIYAAAVHYLSTAAADSEQALARLTSIAAEMDTRRTELDASLEAQAGTEAELAVLAADVTAALDAQAERLSELETLRARELFLATSTTTTTTSPPTTFAASTTTSVSPPASETTTTTAPTTTTTSTTSPTTTPTTSPTTTTTSTTTTTLPPSASTGGSCPVAGPVTYVDSWGAPRSGGRAHQGVDMISARGTPIAAIYSGVIQRMSNSALGGITLWMLSTAGHQFYYAHLDGYADGIAPGVAVSEGQIIGYNGSSGNAPDYLPHLHFEYHPGGGAAANPYPLVRSICG